MNKNHSWRVITVEHLVIEIKAISLNKITKKKSSYSSTLANNVRRSRLPNGKYEIIEMEERESISKEVKKSWQSVQNKVVEHWQVQCEAKGIKGNLPKFLMWSFDVQQTDLTWRLLGYTLGQQHDGYPPYRIWRDSLADLSILIWENIWRI